MKDLIKRHQAAQWERGTITPTTTIHDFMAKIEEEFYETQNEYADLYARGFVVPGEKLKQECVDLVMVTVNMLTFFGVDFLDELRKNTKYQEDRI